MRGQFQVELDSWPPLRFRKGGFERRCPSQAVQVITGFCGRCLEGFYALFSEFPSHESESKLVTLYPGSICWPVQSFIGETFVDRFQVELRFAKGSRGC